jgi:hypothetical protein
VQLALAQGWVDSEDHIVVISRSQADEVMVKVGRGTGRYRLAVHFAVRPRQ